MEEGLGHRGAYHRVLFEPGVSVLLSQDVGWLLQEVISNLGVSRLEFRSEDDPDVVKYTHGKSIEVLTSSHCSPLLCLRRMFHLPLMQLVCLW